MSGRDRIDLAQDLAFQRREWRFQRMGVLALVCFVLAALLGVFGGGPISRADASAGGLTVDYERLTRANRTTRLEIEWPAAAGEPELFLTRSYFDALTIERIDPEPVALEIGRDEVRFRFAPGSRPTMAAVLDVQPRTPGRLQAGVRTGTGASVAYSQLAFF